MALTEKELNALIKSKVVKLARYYGLDVNMRMLKGDIIAKILEVTTPKEEAEEPQMSVRVRRIKESNKE
jgi:hypothetical protein